MSNKNVCSQISSYEIRSLIFTVDFLQVEFFPTWEDYCSYMAQDRVWGDHLTLTAISQIFKTKIFILSSLELEDGQDPCTVIVPTNWERGNIIFLSHLHELHYSSLCPDEGFQVA